MRMWSADDASGKSPTVIGPYGEAGPAAIIDHPFWVEARGMFHTKLQPSSKPCPYSAIQYSLQRNPCIQVDIHTTCARREDRCRRPYVDSSPCPCPRPMLTHHRRRRNLHGRLLSADARPAGSTRRQCPPKGPCPWRCDLATRGPVARARWAANRDAALRKSAYPAGEWRGGRTLAHSARCYRIVSSSPWR